MILVFSLGPVQGFIAQARRTSDGWVGSSLLSLLAAHAVRTIADGADTLPAHADRRVLEPSLRGPLLDAVRAGSPAPRSINGDTSVPSLPNTVVVALGADDDPMNVGATMAAAATTVWRSLASEVWRQLPAALTRRAAVADLWRSQCDSLWEMHWGWGEDSLTAFRALSARKALRDALAPLERGERCTVNPDRVALWDAGDVRGGERLRDTVTRQWRDWTPDIIALPGVPENLIKAEGRERLSASALLRRLVPYTDNALRRLWDAGTDSPDTPHIFPSTSTVAVASFRPAVVEEAIMDADLAAATRGYLQALGRYATMADPLGQFAANRVVQRLAQLGAGEGAYLDPDETRRLLRLDGDWYLYGDAVRNEYQKLEQHAEIETAYRVWLRALQARGDTRLSRPPIYYALLAMDGDAMGDFLGQVAVAGGDTGSISEVLVEFATAVRRLVNERNGRLVYAGGDDVVALFPVETNAETGETILHAADAIRCDFRDRFERWREVHWRDAWGVWQPRSQSAGIVLAHHQAPLGRVITSAHTLLKQWAKQRAGRNACAMQIHRRGDASVTFACRWEHPGTGTGQGWQLVEAMHAVASAMSDEALSRGMAHRLRDELPVLSDAGPFNDPDRVAWVRRTLGRSGLREGANDAANTALAELLVALGRASHGDEGVSGFTAAPALIARFLHGGGREERR